MHVYGEMFAHIYNQAFVFAVIHSATESTLPVVVQHQQSEPPTPKPTHVLTYTHSHTHTEALMMEAEQPFLLSSHGA